MGCVVRLVAFAVIAVSVAGCSAEVTRFDDNPFANPFAKNEPRRSDATSAVPPSPSHIESQPLPQVQSYQPPPPASYQPPPQPSYRQSEYAPAYRPTEYAPSYRQGDEPLITGTASGSPGIASYNPRTSYDVITTGAVNGSARGNWRWDGGTVVIVKPGETIDGLAHKHGVPVVAILRANRLTSNTVIHPGQKLVIPRRGYGSVVAAGALPSHPPESKPAPHGIEPAMWRAPRIPPTGAVHIVQLRETLSSIASRYGRTVTEIAVANHIPPYTRLKAGDRLVIPGTAMAEAPKQISPPSVQPHAAPPAPKKFGSGGGDPQPKPDLAGPGEDETATIGGLRWPAHGHIISRWHDKLDNGQLNEGINLALPEGTPIHAAEDGQVVYAGSELKGYGNLILIRHPNGFVTAYAHAADIAVKRDDPIKRGQVIAHAGQTGDVASPQLHFETRKGRMPVDPMQYLPPG